VRRPVTAGDLLAQAEANGYKREHKEQYKVWERHKHVEKTKKDQNTALNRYVLYLRLCSAASISWESDAESWVRNRRVVPHAR